MKKKKLLYNPAKDDFEYLDPSDQLEYNKTLGTFKKGNKTGALSDFKEEIFDCISLNLSTIVFICLPLKIDIF